MFIATFSPNRVNALEIPTFRFVAETVEAAKSAVGERFPDSHQGQWVPLKESVGTVWQDNAGAINGGHYYDVLEADTTGTKWINAISGVGFVTIKPIEFIAG